MKIAFKSTVVIVSMEPIVTINLNFQNINLKKTRVISKKMKQMMPIRLQRVLEEERKKKTIRNTFSISLTKFRKE